jgi:hypothetical protein
MNCFLKVHLFILLSLSCTHSFSQTGLWTWISGSKQYGAGGTYGIQGVPSVNNCPPAQFEYSTWKDLQGNFWLYGGYDSLLSDLWKYNPVTNEWTWVKGTALPNQLQVYGTMGIPDPANTPGQRINSVCTWVDSNGNLWLFGGEYNRNDLWKYDISSNEWTWVNGSNLMSGIGNYGNQGIPSPTNLPPGRSGTCISWIDSLDNLWLFGGIIGGGSFLNDLWRYSIATNEWTWMSGSNVPNDPGYYGGKGVIDPVNRPSARADASKWQDHYGNFWLMGGSDITAFKEDVWKFDPAINDWTWMAGTATDWDGGLYQNICKLDTNNRPGFRALATSAVTDSCGRFWLFGGYTGDCTNDLWVFDPYELKWMWESGTNVPNRPNHFGTMGDPDPANSPASRYGSASWWGNDGRFYLFGGAKNLSHSPSFGGLWVFEPDNRCIPTCGSMPLANFSARNEVCAGDCIDYTNLSLNASYYQWNFTGASNPNSTNENPQHVCYYFTGSYDVILIAANGVTYDTLITTITVYPTPPPQSIFQSGDTLSANQGAATYSWFLNSVLISGATNYYYVATQSGNYQVVSVDNHGCESVAWAYNVIAGIQSAIGNGQLAIFPNPVEESLYVISYKPATEISVYNILGEKMFSNYFTEQKNEYTLDVHELPAGVYWLKVTSEKKTVQIKFLKR